MKDYTDEDVRTFYAAHPAWSDLPPDAIEGSITFNRWVAGRRASELRQEIVGAVEPKLQRFLSWLHRS